MRDTAGDRRSGHSADDSFPDQDICSDASQERSSKQDRRQQQLTARMRVSQKNRNLGKNHQKTSGEHAFCRISFDQKHHQQTHDTA